MKTTVILIRHGETDWNVVRRFQGLSDIPLNDTGRQQAGFAKNGLDGKIIDAIYTSPLQRAVETAEIIRKHEGKTVLIVSHIILMLKILMIKQERVYLNH